MPSLPSAAAPRLSLALSAAFCTLAHAGCVPTLAKKLLHVVRSHNSAAATAAAARAFVVNGEAIGRVLPNSAALLSEYPDVFEVNEHAVLLRERAGATADERTESVAAVINQIRSQGCCPLLADSKWRDESFAIRSHFHAAPSLYVERAAAGLFGCPAYGVFLNGFVADGGDDGWGGPRPTALWLGRRSRSKPTWPGLLDCLAAGGVAAGKLPAQAMVDECMEEADVPEAMARRALASSAISYCSIDETGWALKRDCLFTFDLRCPAAGWTPACHDGEVDSFELMPLEAVAELVAHDDGLFKPNVAVVIADFLVRHGLVGADEPGFLELCGELRGAECR
jgi:hypothetical protein